MKTVKILSIILLALMVVSCSSIINGTKDKVSVTTNPDATVVIKSTSGLEFYNGSAPVEIELPKKNEYTVSIKLEGYKEEQIIITKSLEGWYIGNICCGGLVGLVIDAVDGAMWKLEPNKINITMKVASNGRVKETYALLRTIDDNGEIRTLVVPMIKQS